MLEVQKEALANRTRQRLVALREKELDYYTANCRMLGNQSALVSGFATRLSVTTTGWSSRSRAA